jgi:thiamine-phosphate pyrophosphorylase
MRLRGLYAVTPDRADSEVLLRHVAAVLQARPAALQYRNKSASPAQRRAEARALAGMCRRHGVPLIVNDDVELAVEVDAAGAHLGRDDTALAAARARLGAKLLGASCYDSLAKARTAVAQGASYVAFGSVFPSPTKPAAVRAPLELFGTARALGVPLVAIGGITLENAPAVIAAGADCVAVISALFDAPDPGAAARAFAQLFERPQAVCA